MPIDLENYAGHAGISLHLISGFKEEDGRHQRKEERLGAQVLQGRPNTTGYERQRKAEAYKFKRHQKYNALRIQKRT